MSRLDPRKLPPVWPKPDKRWAAMRRYRKAAAEYRRVQGSPFTHGNFSLYSWYGRLYLALGAGFLVFMGCIFLKTLIARPPRLLEEWLLSFTLPIGAVAVSTVLFFMYRAHRRIYRLSHNLCPDCGYDLRESAGRCPECGIES